MKLWAMPCRATQAGQIMVESSDKTWSTGEGNGKPLQYACLENPMISMKRQKVRTPKDELPRSVGAQYATGDQLRNNSRKNEEREKMKSLNCVWLFATPWTIARQAPLCMEFPKQEYLNCHFLLQEIFPTQVSCIGCQILYHWANWGVSLPPFYFYFLLFCGSYISFFISYFVCVFSFLCG